VRHLPLARLAGDTADGPGRVGPFDDVSAHPPFERREQRYAALRVRVPRITGPGSVPAKVQLL
jgi:hypothetical protein